MVRVGRTQTSLEHSPTDCSGIGGRVGVGSDTWAPTVDEHVAEEQRGLHVVVGCAAAGAANLVVVEHTGFTRCKRVHVSTTIISDIHCC